MKIIQSFAKFDEGSPYSNGKKAYLNFIKRKIRMDFPRHVFRINKYETELIKQGIIC